MPRYAIIETDAGLTIVEVQPGVSLEDTALRHGGVVVDPGPYESYDEACDAMMGLKFEEDEDDF